METEIATGTIEEMIIAGMTIVGMTTAEETMGEEVRHHTIDVVRQALTEIVLHIAVRDNLDEIFNDFCTLEIDPHLYALNFSGRY